LTMTGNSTLGIIGYGNMGSALGERWRSRSRIKVFEKDASRIAALAPETVAATLDALCAEAQTLILAVKPQDLDSVLTRIKGSVGHALVVSIAAGIPTAYLEKRLGPVRVVRAMPNLAVRVGKGTIALCKGAYARENDVAFMQELFALLGRTLVIEERLMDAVTAVSGSGPGFFFELVQQMPDAEWDAFARNSFIPSLTVCAQKAGFSAEQAGLLAAATAEGSIGLLRQTGMPAAALRDQVTSRGGTTEAGLKALRENGRLEEAVKAAVKRAGELART